MTPPRVDISVASRFHAFDLARELDTAGMLRTVHTGYPSFSGPRFGVRASAIRTIWTQMPLYYGLRALERRGLAGRQADYLVSERHDRVVASRLRPGAHVFVGWSSQCRRSLGRARQLGMAAIVERGSTHIQWQARILKEEADATGLPVEQPHPRTVEQELREYEAADFISVPTTFSARTFAAHGIPSSKLLVNPYGVDLRLFQPVEHEPREPHKVRVIHVGRASVQKGIHCLVEAARQSDAELTIVGNVPDGMHRHLQRPHVTLTGTVPGHSLPDHYARANVFCLLSLQEGLALVVLQAMAMGLPVIATPNTGAEDVIRDGVEGYIVPARDPEAAAARIVALRDPQLRRTMGEAARRRVESGFDWASYGARARALYSGLQAAV